MLLSWKLNGGPLQHKTLCHIYCPRAHSNVFGCHFESSIQFLSKKCITFNFIRSEYKYCLKSEFSHSIKLYAMKDVCVVSQPRVNVGNIYIHYTFGNKLFLLYLLWLWLKNIYMYLSTADGFMSTKLQNYTYIIGCVGVLVYVCRIQFN